MIKKKTNHQNSLRVILGLLKKDLMTSVFTLPGWLVITVFDSVILWLFLGNFFLIGQVDLSNLFSIFSWGLLILAAALSAWSFSREKHNQTLELLLSLPISPWQLIIAKFMVGLITFFLISLTFIPFILLVSQLGTLDIGQVFSAWLGSWFLFSFFLSFSLFTSLFIRNVVFGFLFNLFSLFIVYLVGSTFVLSRLPFTISRFVVIFSIPNAWQGFLIGAPNLAGITLLLSFTILFLFLMLIELKDKLV